MTAKLLIVVVVSHISLTQQFRPDEDEDEYYYSLLYRTTWGSR